MEFSVSQKVRKWWPCSTRRNFRACSDMMYWSSYFGTLTFRSTHACWCITCKNWATKRCCLFRERVWKHTVVWFELILYSIKPILRVWLRLLIDNYVCLKTHPSVVTDDIGSQRDSGLLLQGMYVWDIYVWLCDMQHICWVYRGVAVFRRSACTKTFTQYWSCILVVYGVNV